MSPAADAILRCTGCRTKNRIPADKVGETARCGKCGARMESAPAFTGRSLMISDRDFETQVLQSPLPVLIFCWATWCPTCAQVAPIMDQLAAEWRGRVRVAKVNVDQSPMIAARFQIRSVPFLFVFDSGQLKESMVGGLPKAQIVAIMSKYMY
jgi:thioredoxin 2